MSDDLTRLRTIAAAATPGPWETEHEVVTGGTEQPDPCWLITSEAAKFGYIGEFFSENNAYFIATFDPPTVTALIDRLAVSDAETAARQAEVERLLVRAERAERERDEAKRHALSAMNARDEQRRMKEGNIRALDHACSELAALRAAVTRLADEWLQEGAASARQQFGEETTEAQAERLRLRAIQFKAQSDRVRAMLTDEQKQHTSSQPKVGSQP